ncbi:uncharacterized protein ISCGN_005562 [Ixodes scapularis]
MRLSLLALFGLLACLKTPIVSCSQRTRQSQIQDMLRARIPKQGQDIAFLSPNGAWADVDHAWMRWLPWRYTSWLSVEGGLSDWLRDSVDTGTGTVVLLPSCPKSERDNCDKRLRLLMRYVDPQDVIVLPGDEASSALKNDSAETTSASRSALSAGAAQFGPPQRLNNDRYNRSARLAGQVVNIGCLRVLGAQYSCQRRQFRRLIRLLMLTNVTLRTRYYATTAKLREATVDREEVDIILAPIVMTHTLISVEQYPDVLSYGYATFYSRANVAEVISFASILNHSGVAISFLFISLLVCFLSLCLMDCLERGAVRVNGNNLMFLLAAFYATSSRAPVYSSWENSRRIICIVWLVGTLPLSVYFRGRLTSLLSLRVPSNALDTVEELEEALDLKKIVPCVVEGSYQHYVLANANLNNTSVMRKLNEAYTRNDKAEIVASYPRECLLCASGDSRICFIIKQNQCFVKSLGHDVQESKDRFMLSLTTTPVRKYFPLKGLYRKFLQQVRETALLRDGPPWCGSVDMKENTSSNLPLNLSSFFRLYVIAMCVAVVVLALEIIIAAVHLRFSCLLE